MNILNFDFNSIEDYQINEIHSIIILVAMLLEKNYVFKIMKTCVP